MAIDTISKLEEWCEAEAKTIYMQTPMGKNFEQKNPGASVLSLPNGAGYLYLRIAYKKWIDRLNKLADPCYLGWPPEGQDARKERQRGCCKGP